MSKRRWSYEVAFLFSIAALMISATALSGYILDGLGFFKKWGLSSVEMAPNTAMSLVLLSAALMLLAARKGE